MSSYFPNQPQQQNTGDNQQSRNECDCGQCGDFIIRNGLCVGITTGIISIIAIVLIAISFSYVEVNEVGLAKGRVSQRVDTSKVYKMDFDTIGRHQLGPNKQMETFDAAFQQESFQLSIITQESKSIATLIKAVYRIKQDEMGDLYEDHTKNWKVQAKTKIEEAIKNLAPNYPMEDYIQNLEKIRVAFQTKIQQVLNDTHLMLPDYCLMILDVDPARDVIQQKLQNAVELQVNAKQLFQREVELIKQDTEVQKQNITSTRSRITKTGEAQKNEIIQISLATKRTMIETAQSEGFDKYFDFFGITDPNQRALFLELRAYENPHIKLISGFDGANALISV